jgi:hypothetical protein
LKEGKSCVVSYHTPLSIDLYYLASSVLVYLNRKLLNKEGKISCCNHDAKNNSILIENIITVELIEYDKLKRAILNLYKY